MTITSYTDARDIDADDTLKIVALDGRRLADLPPELEGPTRNQLPYERRAALRKLTSPAQKGGRAQQWVLPPVSAPPVRVAGAQVPGEQVSVVRLGELSVPAIAAPADARRLLGGTAPAAPAHPAALLAGALQTIKGTVLRFALAGLGLATSLGSMLLRYVTIYLAQARRARVAALHSAQRARWKAPPAGQPPVWRQLGNLLQPRSFSRR